MKKQKTSFSFYKLIVGGVLCLFALSFFLIVYWGLVTALKSQGEFRTNVLSIPKGWPWEWEWNNVVLLFQNFTVTVGNKQIGFLKVMYNTIVYALGGAFIATMVPCCVAYVTSRFDFKMSKVIYTSVLIIMVLPIVGNLPSMVYVLDVFHLYDTLIGCLIQKFHFLNMYFMVFFATFKGVPKDYSEAAYIDGASELRVFLQVIFPLVKTGFLTIMLIFFIDFWNDYQTPLLYMRSYPTLSYAVYHIANETKLTGLSTVPMRMVTCIVMVIPTTALFILFKDKMIGNLSMGGIKG